MAKQTTSTLGEILGKVMGEHGLGRGGIMAKLLSVWDGTVGAGIAKHALPESIKGGILTVTVDSPVWMHQLSMMAPGLTRASASSNLFSPRRPASTSGGPLPPQCT